MLELIGLLCISLIKLLFILTVLELNTFLKRFKQSLETNTFMTQANNSVMCGDFCISFNNFMIAGKTLIGFTSFRFTLLFLKNDNIILSYFKNE